MLVSHARDIAVTSTDENTAWKAPGLLDSVDLRDAVVTADAAHAQCETAEYIVGEREADYSLLKGNQPSLQRAAFDVVQEQGPPHP